MKKIKKIFIFLSLAMFLFPINIVAKTLDKTDSEIQVRMGVHDVVIDYRIYKGSSIPWSGSYTEDGYTYHYSGSLRFVGMNGIKFTYYGAMGSDLKVYKVCTSTGCME